MVIWWFGGRVPITPSKMGRFRWEVGNHCSTTYTNPNHQRIQTLSRRSHSIPNSRIWYCNSVENRSYHSYALIKLLTPLTPELLILTTKFKLYAVRQIILPSTVKHHIVRLNIPALYGYHNSNGGLLHCSFNTIRTDTAMSGRRPIKLWQPHSAGIFNRTMWCFAVITLD